MREGSGRTEEAFVGDRSGGRSKGARQRRDLPLIDRAGLSWVKIGVVALFHTELGQKQARVSLDARQAGRYAGEIAAIQRQDALAARASDPMGSIGVLERLPRRRALI